MMISPPGQRNVSARAVLLTGLLGFSVAAVVLAVFVVVTAVHQHRSPWGAWTIFAGLALNGLVATAVSYYLMRRDPAARS